jgi:orotidine-5'-phosphate decarboxylase
MSDPRERLIIALDVSSAAAARKIVAAVGESGSFYKVGKQLFTAEGPQVVRDLVASGKKVFLDLKYHDIPNTVGAAVAEAAKLGVTMLTVHASGGGRMLQSAVASANAVVSRPMILGVTVLTSLGDHDLETIGVRGGVTSEVLRLGALAITSGCGGIVASAREASELRKELGNYFAIVTPGVRPAGSGHGDQVRVVTPSEAMASGSTHIVVGRPITESPDPCAETREILAEIESVGVAG